MIEPIVIMQRGRQGAVLLGDRVSSKKCQDTSKIMLDRVMGSVISGLGWVATFRLNTATAVKEAESEIRLSPRPPLIVL